MQCVHCFLVQSRLKVSPTIFKLIYSLIPYDFQVEKDPQQIHDCNNRPAVKSKRGGRRIERMSPTAANIFGCRHTTHTRSPPDDVSCQLLRSEKAVEKVVGGCFPSCQCVSEAKNATRALILERILVHDALGYRL